MNYSLVATILARLSRLRHLATRLRYIVGLVLTVLTPLLLPGRVLAQADSSRVQVARVVVDANKLDQYRTALKEQVETSMRIEPGVLLLYAVADKKNPTHITLMERYASEAAHQAHMKAPHFLKYRATVKGMVQSVVLLETTPLVLEAKPQRSGKF